MNILFTSAEAGPFAKVGGLGDVVAAGSLPTALRELGLDARVMIPLYGTIDRSKFNIKHLFSFYFPRRSDVAHVHVHKTEWNGVPFYFIESWPHFGEESEIYSDWNLDVPRYIFFNQVAMAAAWELQREEEWFPDVFHVNDWHTGLIPFFIKQSSDNPVWAKVRTMITLHNMAHQGAQVGGWLWDLGVPGRNHPELQRQGLSDNMLAIGIAYADYVTTVSPRHADEIQYPYMGYNLADLVHSRTYDNKLYGILNGIDTETFDPKTDRYIYKRFDVTSFENGKRENKRRLQAEAGLEVNDDIPLIGLVSRLVWQKGIDIAVPAIRELLSTRDAQFIVLGTGDADLSAQLWHIAQDFPNKARAYILYNPAIAQRIYAGSDLFLMPSHYEPCGIGQMIAMRYGSLPVVRETGGLADTVENFDDLNGEKGTGFVFLWEQPDALLNTLNWAVDTYRDKRDIWKIMQKRAMEKDFSWERSAKIYATLYQEILA